MDSKTYGIGILTLTAVALLIANLFAPKPAAAIEAVSNGEMQAVTCRYLNGGDAVYLLDHSTSKLAIFTIDNKAGLVVRRVVELEDAFRGNAGGGARGNAGGRK